MANQKRKKGKGTFSDLRLTVADDYISAPSRRIMFLVAGIAALGILVFFLFSVFFRNNNLISNGPLSSNHANLERDCAACHTPLASVTNEKCSVCHEKYGDKLGVYTFVAHYVYRADDFRRVVPSEKETACFSCHPEHLGRERLITDVPDTRCLRCHHFGSFNAKHPQFEFAAKQIPDDSALEFTHIRHVNKVKEKGKFADIEKACLFCHNPQPDGKIFQPISFDRHCDACHLTTGVATPRLQIRDAGAPQVPGVETLEMIRERQRPGSLWAFYANPNEFRQVGSRVSKSPVYHEDPWIMENLKMLRRAFYAEVGLADLLKATGNVPPHQARLLYQEAIRTLRDYAVGLRARPEPEIQNDLARIDSLLALIEKKIADPYSPLDDAKFLLSGAAENSRLAPERAEEFENFVNDLTAPCRQCHAVSNASIARVQKDQRVLRRAEFNHRAHVLQKRCLDCHAEIPIEERLGNAANVDRAIDRAAIQNIPAIEECRACHTAEIASNRCVTCHYFHPNKTQRSSLLLYLD